MPTWVGKLVKIFATSTIIGFLLHPYLFFSETGEFPSYFSNINSAFTVFTFANIVGIILYFFNKRINQFSALSEKNNSRLIMAVILNYFMLTVLLILALIVYLNWFSGISSDVFFEKYNGLLYKVFILAFVLVFLFVIIDFSVRSYQKFSQIRLNAVQSAHEQSQLQLEAFKSQLSPHYLFNNLNTISLLVYKDAELSEKYIRKLSQTYDYIIETNKKDLVKLSEELEFIRAYKYLLDIRFQDNLLINLNIPKLKQNFYLPPLCIQILIENAVKHNSPTDENRLIIDIDKVDKYVRVRNNLLRTPSKTDSFKIGLNNLRKRYKYHTSKEIIIEKNTVFTAKIPLLKSDKNRQLHDVSALV